jgi:hypothetical protein
MITCPPIGAHGYVMYPGGDLKTIPVWMGAAVVTADTNSMKNANAKRTVAPELTDPTDFLIKTQYTTKRNQTLNTQANKVENFVKLNEEAIVLAHVRQDDYTNYTYSEPNILNQPVNSLVIKNDSITINLKHRGNSASNSNNLIISENGIELNFKSQQATSSIKLTTDGIKLDVNGKNSINIGTDGIIKIDSEKEIQLNGSSDNVTRWSGFNDFVNVFNDHVHGTSEGLSSDNLNKFNDAGSAKSTKVKIG